MWPRTVELMLACWLAISPYVFGHDPADALPWIVDYMAAAIVGSAALMSFHRRLYRAHLASPVVAVALVVVAFVASPADPPPPAYQNHMAVGLLLLMFGILPSHCKQPPRRWRDYHATTESRDAAA